MSRFKICIHPVIYNHHFRCLTPNGRTTLNNNRLVFIWMYLFTYYANINLQISYLPNCDSQFLPVKSSRHKHSKSLTPSTQVPPFWHGSGLQSSTFKMTELKAQIYNDDVRPIYKMYRRTLAEQVVYEDRNYQCTKYLVIYLKNNHLVYISM